MKYHSGLALFFGVAHGAATESGLMAREGQPDSQTLAVYAKSGQCYYYYTEKKNWNKAIQPCETYCANNGGHGYAQCDGSPFANVDLSKSGQALFTDDDGFPWAPAKCKCSNPDVEGLANEIITVVAEALSQLDNVLCAVFVSAIKEIVDIGLMFVPGGAAVKGAGKVIQYAKSAYENGMDASQFYTDWVGQACGVPGWSFSLEDMFTDMVNAPDSMMGAGVSSTGCLPKAKKCNKRDPKPDPKTSSQVHGGKSTKKEEGTSTKKEESTSTNDNPPSSTQSPNACKLKRAAYKPDPVRKVNKFGDIETRSEEQCTNGQTTTITHFTYTDPAIGYYVQDRKDIPKITCKKDHTQACYHYRSIMSRYSATRDMTEWTCQATSTSWSSGGRSNWGNNGRATNKWGNTALAKRSGTQQHWFPWANGYVYNEALIKDGKPARDKNGDLIYDGCERDEFPPRYFWPGDSKAPKNMRQWIRFLPGPENRGGGHLWAGFCNDHNAALTKNFANKPRETYVVSANLKSDKAITRVETKGKDTTIHSTIKVSTLRAIFSIAEFEGLKLNEDGLKDNPCYPKALVDDPGWALLTDDPWYDDHPASKVNIPNYLKAPSKAMVDAANAKADAARKNGEKLESLPAFDLDEVMQKFNVKTEKDLWKKFVGAGNGQIPEDLWGVLPTIPKFPKPNKRSFADIAAANYTLSREDLDADDLDWDGDEDDVDSMDDEELRRWLEDYEEIMHRMYEVAGYGDDVESPTIPPEIPAEPTSIPHNERDRINQPTPAMEGSNASGGIPRPTPM